jgi:hypothetical protein
MAKPVAHTVTILHSIVSTFHDIHSQHVPPCDSTAMGLDSVLNILDMPCACH